MKMESVRGAGQRGILLGLSLLMMGSTAQAFDQFPVGARPEAMGGAFTALADDVHSLYYNPAGLATLFRPKITAYYAKPWSNLSDDTSMGHMFLGGAGPLGLGGRWGGVGGSYEEFKVDKMYKEQTFTVGYAKTFLEDRLSLGTGLKWLMRSYGSDAYTEGSTSVDPIFSGGKSASNLGVDVGGLLAINSTVFLGLSVLNINRPDMSLSSGDRLPMTTRLGTSFQTDFLKMNADITRTLTSGEKDTRFLLGGERSWAFRRFGLLSIRGGAGIGSRDYRQVNVGAGYEINGIGFDYVFTMPLGAANDMGNSQNVSLSYGFGSSPAEDEIQSLVLQEKSATSRAAESLRLAEEEAWALRQEEEALATQYVSELERLKAELADTRQGKTQKTDTVSREKREKEARVSAQKNFTEAYQAAMKAYTARANRGATPESRREQLQGILSKYSGKGVDVSQAQRELESLKFE